MKTTLAIAASLLLLTVAASAQEPPSLFSVREEIARPAMAAQYETASHDLMALLAAQNADPKLLTVHTYVSADLHYLYVTPIANYASIDAMIAAFMKTGTAAGAKWTDMMSRNAAALVSWNDFVMLRRADLSYTPATPRVKREEIRFVHLTYYYLDPAHIADAEQVARDWAALFKSKTSGESYSVYQVMTGQDLPLFIIADYAKDALDYYTARQNVMTSMPEIRGLIARSGAATRRIEFRDVVYRPDLSYAAPGGK